VVAIIIVQICGYCSHYTKDTDFPDLFGICSFKPGRYISFRANGCGQWEMRISIDSIKKEEDDFTRYRL
jgi:hypothetical protein